MSELCNSFQESAADDVYVWQRKGEHKDRAGDSFLPQATNYTLHQNICVHRFIHFLFNVIIFIFYKTQKGPILNSSAISKSTTTTTPCSPHTLWAYLTAVAWQHREADDGSIAISDLTMFFCHTCKIENHMCWWVWKGGQNEGVFAILNSLINVWAYTTQNLTEAQK